VCLDVKKEEGEGGRERVTSKMYKPRPRGISQSDSGNGAYFSLVVVSFSFLNVCSSCLWLA